MLAWVGIALIDVSFAARSGESLGAVTLERPGRVDTNAAVLARGALLTLVDVLGAVDASITAWARANVRSIDGAGLAVGSGVARVAGAGIIQMAQ